MATEFRLSAHPYSTMRDALPELLTRCAPCWMDSMAGLTKSFLVDDGQRGSHVCDSERSGTAGFTHVVLSCREIRTSVGDYSGSRPRSRVTLLW